MNDETLKPSVIPNLCTIYDGLKRLGLGRYDLVTLLQKRTRLSRKNIEKTLNSLLYIENKMIEAELKRNIAKDEIGDVKNE